MEVVPVLDSLRGGGGDSVQECTRFLDDGEKGVRDGSAAEEVRLRWKLSPYEVENETGERGEEEARRAHEPQRIRGEAGVREGFRYAGGRARGRATVSDPREAEGALVQARRPTLNEIRTRERLELRLRGRVRRPSRVNPRSAHFPSFRKNNLRLELIFGIFYQKIILPFSHSRTRSARSSERSTVREAKK